MKQLANTLSSLFIAALTAIAWPGVSTADSAAEMARKMNNPLANIKALMTDNAIGFDTGDDKGTSYGFQLQPVYAIDMPEYGFTFIPRAVIPILGLEPGTTVPRLGIGTDPMSGGGNSVWGLGDTMIQMFFAPHSDSEWKWGIGPTVSIATHTKSELKGPDWGGGVVGVVTGNITPDLAFAGIVGNHWSFNGDFNTASIQPMFFYSVPSNPGTTISYNAVTTVDWTADADNRWTVPLGLSVGKTWDMGGGHGLDMSIGPYYNVVRPEGAAGWQIRFGINWLFP